MKDDTRFVLELIKTLALVAIAATLFCLVYAVWPMIPIFS